MSEDFTQRSLGMIPSPVNISYYKLNQFMDLFPESEMPEEYLVKPFQTEDELPIFNQFSYGTCVAQSLSWCQAQRQAVETGLAFKRLSSSWIYANRLATDNQSEGMVPSQALARLIVDGTPSFEDFADFGDYPELRQIFDTKKAALLPKAVPNRALSYVQLSTPAEVKTALMVLGAVPIGITVYKNFYNVGDNGIVPKRGASEAVGGHMMAIVGWKRIMGVRYWIIVNSWGLQWGKRGVCYMPYDYEGIDELWAVTDYQKRDLESVVPAQILNPGAFVLPVRAVCEALGAEVTFVIKDGKKVAEAVIPPSMLTRKITVVQNSKTVTVEVVE